MTGRAVLVTAVLVVAIRMMGSGASDGGDAVQPPRATPEPREDVQRVLDLAEDGASVAKQRRALRSYLAGRGISRGTMAAVLRHTRDGIALHAGPRDARSRIGGRPVLPAGEPWPTSSGGPFKFIGAFDLAELPHLKPLPAKGTLALYWNVAHWFEDEGPGKMDFVAATRAYYLPPGARVTRPVAPEESYPLDVTPLRGIAMPIAGDPNLVFDEIEGRADADGAIEAMNDLSHAGLYPNHLLGAPIEIQGPVLEGMRSFFDPKFGYLSEQSRARFTRAEREAGDWILLAQINEEHGLTISDGGTIHFVILRRDLEARRFDRVVGIMESH